MAEEEIENICNMGGAVSGGKSNDELVDNLIENNFIRSRQVQRAFRAVDRGNYYQPGHREDAYKDVAWRMGNLHVSAPCIYGVVMEALKLEPGLSFLNLGSGSGYLSTMAGLILGCYGINHGIELHKDVVDFAEERLDYFLKHSRAVDELDFCEPAFTWGNLLRLADTQQYDRVYCSVTVPEEYECYIKSFVKINGILVIPLKDKLLKLTRTSETEWQSGKLLNVHFASIILPPAVQKGELIEHVKLGDISPPNLQQICRFFIRSKLRQYISIEHPNLKLSYVLTESRPRRQVRRIVIPFFEETDFSNSDTNSDLDSDSPEYSISSHLPLRMHGILEGFLRRHAELQLLKRMEEEHSSECETNLKSETNVESKTEEELQLLKLMEEEEEEKHSSESEINTKCETNNVAETDEELQILRHILGGESSECENNAKQNKSDKTFPTETNKTNVQESNQQKSRLEYLPLISEVSSTNVDSTPSSSQSTRSNTLQKRKLTNYPSLHSSSELFYSSSEDSSNSDDDFEPYRRFMEAPRVKRRKIDAENVKKSKESEVNKSETKENETDNENYTSYLIKKIAKLPLPPLLLSYLNYKRNCKKS